MAVDVLGARDTLVHSLRRSLVEGSHGLGVVPGLVTRVVDEECWRERRVDALMGQVVQFTRFEEFVQSSPPEGLGVELRMLRQMCQDHPEALDAIDRATVGRQGERTDLFNNVQEVKAPVGNSNQAAIRRLRKARPDLHAQVLAGEKSPHAAMREAGFRPPTATVRLDDPEATARTLRRATAPEFIASLIEHLQVEGD